MLKKIVIVMMLIYLVILLTGCGVTDNKVINNCRQSVTTYGDAIECMIQLDNLQNQ